MSIDKARRPLGYAPAYSAGARPGHCRAPQPYFLLRNLRRYTYPQLTLAGGVGERVLELAMDAAGYDVP